jgi:L-fuconolactonase
MTPAAIVDSHHHLWDLSAHDQPFLASAPELAPLLRDFTTADLAPLAAAAGVTATVVVQTVSEPGETAELLQIAAGPSVVSAVVGWVDVTAPDAADALAELAALPGSAALAGIRNPAMTEPDPGWLARPDVLRGLAAVAAAGLTFDVVCRPEQLPAATQAAAALPGLVVVLDHLGNVEVEPAAGETSVVDERWAAAFRAFAALPNTVAKLSGFLSVPAPAAWPPVAHLRPYYRIALESFGPQRLMFGSDWPVSTLGSPYGDVVGAARALTSDLSPAEQEAIFGGTARRVYQIENGGPGRAGPG